MSEELNKFDILKLFKNNLLKFLDALIEQFPQESDLILVRIFLSEQIPIEDVLNIFADRIIPHKQMIIEKNEMFFLEKSNILDGLGTDKKNYIRNIWCSNAVTNDDKEQIWKWFKLFLNLAERFKRIC